MIIQTKRHKKHVLNSAPYYKHTTILIPIIIF